MKLNALFVAIILFCIYLEAALFDADTKKALSNSKQERRMFRLYFISYTVTYIQNGDGLKCFGDGYEKCYIYTRVMCGDFARNSDLKESDVFERVVLNNLIEFSVDSKCQEEPAKLLLMRYDNRILNKLSIPSSGFYNNEFKYEESLSDDNDWTFEYEIANWCANDFGSGCEKHCVLLSVTHRCRDYDGEQECVYGYGGDDCQAEINLCINNPCLNNARCKQKGSSFECVCFGGYRGENCEILDCTEKTCLNGACVNYGTYCQCTNVTYGDSCDKNVCPKNYCMNEGVCKTSDTFFYCECPAGFLGEICQHRCFPQCINGQCVLHDSYPVCLCDFSYTGADCSKPTTNSTCINNFCQNGGYCQKALNTLQFLCACSDDWTGVYCDIPRCNTKNCIHGLCADNNECKCMSGYTGSRCDQISCSGLSVCQNEGVCVESSSYSISCVCTNDYTGIHCEQKCNGGCQNHGRCVESAYGYACECDVRYEGKNCEKAIEINVCDYSTCQNGGICLEDQRSYTCACPSYWEGPKCNIPSCTSGKCQNGLCVDGVSCQCFEGYTGRNCESILCESTYCKNNGYCITNGYSLKCECDEKIYTGDICQYSCEKRCQNGKCMETFDKSGKCLCDSGFIGVDCSKRDISTLLTYLFGAITGLTAIIFILSVAIYIYAKKKYIPERDASKERIDHEKVRSNILSKGGFYSISR